MASPSAIPTSPIAELDIDTQKLAVDQKREHDLSRKWAHGIRDGNRYIRAEQHSWDVSARNQGARDAMKAEMKIRPITPSTKSKYERGWTQHTRLSQNRAAKWVDRDAFNSSESSASEESTAPEPDAGITYSFDVTHGPSAGSDILSLAVNKAVERFENKVTEKLVKDEYDVVVPEDDHVVERNAGYAADDEDFEFV